MTPATWYPHGGEAIAGAASRDITPPVGIRARNWGAARGDVATGVHRPLTVTALWLDSAYLVSMDLLSLRPDADAVVRPRVVAELGIAADELLLHSVHTHSGPSCALDESDLPGGELIRPFLDKLTRSIVAACREARATAGPCRLTWSTGQCGLAVVRDLPCGHRDVVAYNPAVPADGTLVVGRVSDHSGDPVAVLLNYACHPTTLAWENSLLSPDFVGSARAIVQDAVGAPCLFLQGASGDLSPREQYVGDTEVADRNGRVLGYAALSELEAMPPPATRMEFTGVVESGAPLGVWRYRLDDRLTVRRRQRIDVPVRLTAERTAEEWPDIDPVAARDRVRRARRLRAQYAGKTAVHHPVWVWLVGDAVLVAHPGEAYSALQTELRRRHPARTILVLNLTNGPGTFYLPTADAYDRDRYQTWQTQYARGALEAVIDAADRAIAQLPDGRTPIER